VFLTNDFDICARFWLFDYLPQLLQADRHLFQSMARFTEHFGTVDITVVPVPADCRDGFLGAYWKRPRAYLDPLVRESISTFSKIGDVAVQLARLERDIDSGVWNKRYPELQHMEQLDLGYRIVVAQAPRLPGR
jgi:hypothetical protein